MDDWTYSAGVVAAWLKAKGWAFEPHSSRAAGVSFTDHGLLIRFGDPSGEGGRTIHVSVQTHPLIAGNAFAETGILLQRKLAFPEPLGYFEEVRKHVDPDALFAHLLEVATALSDPVTFETVVNDSSCPGTK